MGRILGVDLGQANDYTAISLLEFEDEVGRVYNLTRLERTRGKSYPVICRHIEDLMKGLGDARLVVDATGVGTAPVDLFREAGLHPIGVWIHGGDRVTQEPGKYRVPKRDLVATLQVLAQSNRLKISSKLKLGPVLQKEMLNFRVKIDPVTAHDSYSAWREADHDDLVLAVALASWWGERHCHQETKIPVMDESCLGEAYDLGIEPSHLSYLFTR